ncbi:DUF2834 domain-containing protein [Gordonia soli]|uniref:DUF2834 domain-containing protein n=1 Tax=Gordonia soli NBRC 108243 TaxID=1223545 RepID=M0QFR4_9ACTN|nr:DUF2834 domain-containing protein [Gordonia soli]GAC67393.1 hypothetical protein GS4_07_01420 [Gordonia soli NBRC 108243]
MDIGPHSPLRRRLLAAIAATAFVTQNSVAVPYVLDNGWRSTQDFFVGGIWKTVPGRFAMIDLTFVVIGFHAWALLESKRLNILRWWFASFVLTWSVGIATAIPAFLYARDRAIAAALPNNRDDAELAPSSGGRPTS